MAFLLHETLMTTASLMPDNVVLRHDAEGDINAETLLTRTAHMSQELIELGVIPGDRVGILLPKLTATAVAFYAVSMSGAVFVPINPVLKTSQVEHILNDCMIKILVTSTQRVGHIKGAIENSPALETVLLVDDGPADSVARKTYYIDCTLPAALPDSVPPRIDNDLAGILYTSGSTGKPKGVMISHRNLVAGAESVASYLSLTSSDRILAVLPLSFDYGLNQLFSAVSMGACCVLLDYLMPKHVIDAVRKHRITGLAAVPALWTQLAPLDWPDEARDSLRYITNSGGAMPKSTLARLRQLLPDTRMFLMYGLTEAFRSTYLSPEAVARRPDSIGKAIPNAEILVINKAGEVAADNEPGELVHRGALVSLGYWNSAEETALRFRPAPVAHREFPLKEIAVWSGDTVYRDPDGYLYFVGRDDGMLKTSGYRVSPEEIEDCVYSCGLPIELVVAVGIPDKNIGHEIGLVIQPQLDATVDCEELRRLCGSALPNYMAPRFVLIEEHLPVNQNGKLDRPAITKLAEARRHTSGESA